MILHIEKEQLLIYKPEDYRHWSGEEATFLKYAQAARAHLKTIIIVAPSNLLAIPKLIREFIVIQRFERIEGPACSYWRRDYSG